MARKTLILNYWEEIYGQLEEKYRTQFLDHRAIEYIQCYEDRHIKKALGEHKKLDEVLKFLEQNHWPPKRKYRVHDEGSFKPGIRYVNEDSADYFSTGEKFNRMNFQSANQCKKCRGQLVEMWNGYFCPKCNP